MNMQKTAQELSYKLGVKEYRIQLRPADDGSLLCWKGDEMYVTEDIILRSFADATFNFLTGKRKLWADIDQDALRDNANPKRHIGRRVGYTASGNNIMINAEFDLTTWQMTSKRYEHPAYAQTPIDHQRLRAIHGSHGTEYAGLETFYERLPVLATCHGTELVGN